MVDVPFHLDANGSEGAPLVSVNSQPVCRSFVNQDLFGIGPAKADPFVVYKIFAVVRVFETPGVVPMARTFQPTRSRQAVGNMPASFLAAPRTTSASAGWI